ncbi:MAG: chalcone isomerase family protein [Gammaproteobacteria bacterium]|nr:chalcone isomerase family protein [Gammaproteobacteria bacterium]MBT8135192.1 chalcone isomerase family protein [Gammaproteobacteria bacterium]NNJ51106.1 chalcone isomerase family protein [Gammaproteobacteria bacterium]
MTTGKGIIHRYAVFLILLQLAFFSVASEAGQLGDVSMPDKVTLEGSDVELQLNGMGYRTKFVFKVYIAALYTESSVNSRDAVLSLKGPKRVIMHMVYDEVEREKIIDGWNDGFEDNNSEQQMDKLQARIEIFNSYFPDLKKGDALLYDFIPDVGTRVTINGEVKGVIEGADFYAALLDIWLGDEPADDDLKDAMLGIMDDE